MSPSIFLSAFCSASLDLAKLGERCPVPSSRVWGADFPRHKKGDGNTHFLERRKDWDLGQGFEGGGCD
jgi:hypothetical protein